MHINLSALSQQHRVQHYAAANDAYDFFNMLTSPDLLETLEALLPVHRERLFPPTETLSMFFAQALKPDRSCQGIVNDAAVKRLIHGLPKCSTNTGGYCKARERLPLEMVTGMVRHTGRLIAAGGSDTWLWRGRRVRLVDGTTVTLPDTRANQTAYPQQSGQKPGLGFPICRIVAQFAADGDDGFLFAAGEVRGKRCGHFEWRHGVDLKGLHPFGVIGMSQAFAIGFRVDACIVN